MDRILLNQLSPLGNSLKRPECVLATQSGDLYASNWDGGVSRIAPDGKTAVLLGAKPGLALRPNGIALLPDGSFLLCHLGDEVGGVYRLLPDGRVQDELLELDGAPLPPTNYAHVDALGRQWITVSTRITPRADAYRADVADGFIILKDNHGARIVAENLGYTNECLVHPDGKRLFVNETFSRRLSSFDIAADGSLSNKKTLTEFGAGTFPDGMAFDAEGHVWVTSIISNRLIRISPEGVQQVVLEDVNSAHLDWVEQAFLDGKLGRPHLDNVKSELLQSVSSLAFGGPDLKTVYLGCLLGDQIMTFRSPVAGLPPPHWTFQSQESSSWKP